MSNLKITRHQREMPFQSFVFPAGEMSVKIDIKNSISFIAKTGVFAPAPYQTIVARIHNSNDLMELILLVDALRRIDDTPINLFMPYAPYARQDRVCVKGEAFSLKVFAGLINNLNFNKVTIFDPHSNVCEGVFDRLEVISQLDVINKWPDFINVLMDSEIVAPDSGSIKKTSEIAGFLDKDSFIRCDKLRNLSNGEIKETIVYSDNLKGKDICILDDICEGGKTFTELAKVLKTKNCGKIILYVTHGIFSRGIPNIIENGIDEIWTTNSYKNFTEFNEDKIYGEKFNILDVEKFLI